jgi:hypothetical protein
VTGDAAFEARELAISGLPAVEEVEVTNAALDALLDTLEMKGARPSHAPDPHGTGRGLQPSAGRITAAPVLDTSSLPAPLASFTPARPNPPLAIGAVNDDGEASSASAVLEQGSGPEAAADAPAEDNLETGSADANTPDARIEAAIERLFVPAGQEAQEHSVEESQKSAVLPDVEDGPALGSPQPAAGRRPALRTNIRELDDGIARLARSLAPRGPRSPQ